MAEETAPDRNDASEMVAEETAVTRDPAGTNFAWNQNIDRPAHRSEATRSLFLANPKVEQIDFQKDVKGHMTFGRRLALWLMHEYKWYNPQLGEKPNEDGVEPPSLAKAWAFFEHGTLERYIVENNHRNSNKEDKTTKEKVINAFHKGDRRLNIAEPGERDLKTKLYSPLTTPLKQMGDFGLGYGIYFSTLRAFAILSLFVGILNIPNLMYFASDEYSGGKPGVSPLLKGSAICTDRSWVPCPSCEEEQFKSFGAYEKTRAAASFLMEANATGDWLNITEYLNWDNVDEKLDWKTVDTSSIFTDEAFSGIYNDYAIRFLSDEIEFGTYYSAFCSDDCLNEYTSCQVNGLNDCFLFVDSQVPYGDSSVLKFAFALKHNCDGATTQQGFVNYASLFLLTVGALIIRMKQNSLEVDFDEDEQTAQDYSIAILNPPSDADDPDEWKAFFEGSFDCKVTVCTVDVANDDIVQLLVERREILRKLEMKLPPGTLLDKKSLKNQCKKARKEETGLMGRFTTGIPDLYNQLKRKTKEIEQELGKQRKLPTTSVFITFEAEKAQRDVLSALTVGTIAARNNDKTALGDSKYLFRGERVLEVCEAEEPSTIRWQEQDATQQQIMWSLLATTLATIVIVIAGCVIIIFIYTIIPAVASLVTTVFTFVFPEVAKILMNKERHRSESSRQKWLFIKISLFNVVITSWLISFITPFTSTLDNKAGSASGLIPVVHDLFFSQLLLSPFLQLADIGGNIQRHLVAPRAKTQEEMNMSMLGSEVFLAERYANLMKFIVLMVWYCAVYPAAFFMGFFALIIAYFTDRFSLMRTWARSPQLGTQIADVARNYFTPAAVVLMAVLSAYSWSGFPYDNLCEDNDSDYKEAYSRNWIIEVEEREDTIFGYTLASTPNTYAEFEVSEGAQLYKYCHQNMRAYAEQSFPPLPKFQPEGFEWMTPDQEKLVTVFGWTSLTVLVSVVALFVYAIGTALVRAYRNTHSSRGDDMNTPFSEVPAIDSYIPQVHSPLFAYPLLLCDITHVDAKLFNWNDPERPHSYYDITKDAKKIMKGEDADFNPFSRVKYWPIKDDVKDADSSAN